MLEKESEQWFCCITGFLIQPLVSKPTHHMAVLSSRNTLCGSTGSWNAQAQSISMSSWQSCDLCQHPCCSSAWHSNNWSHWWNKATSFQLLLVTKEKKISQGPYFTTVAPIWTAVRTDCRWLLVTVPMLGLHRHGTRQSGSVLGVRLHPQHRMQLLCCVPQQVLQVTHEAVHISLPWCLVDDVLVIIVA